MLAAMVLAAVPTMLSNAVGTARVAEAATGPVHYTLTLIGTMNGAHGDVPAGINANGHTTGVGSFPGLGSETAYLSTSPTQVVNLPGVAPSDPDLANASEAFGINDSDTVVGTAYETLPIRQTAVVWHNGKPTDLGLLPADDEVHAVGINNAGQIAGSGVDTGVAFLWQNGTTTLLPALPGGSVDEAFGITQDGQVLGTSTTSNDTSNSEAVTWRNGAPVFLGSLPGSTWGEAHAMNKSGVAVGAVGINGGEFAPRHPAMFVNGKATDLWPDLGGSTFGTANAINGAGTIVGDGLDGWVYSNGVRTDLDKLIPANTGMTITAAYGINDAGQIVASAQPIGQRHVEFAVLLTPVAG